MNTNVQGSSPERMDAPIDKRIAALARRHGGHVTHEQLLALGLGKQAIRYRAGIGQLIRVYRGVYAVGRLPTTRRDQAAGALLACGPSAVLSHRSAAALWSITDTWPLPLELSTTIDRRPTGLRVHVVCSLSRTEITHHHGLRVTTPARTILDLAPHTPARRLTRIINDLRLERRLTIDALRDLTERHARHPGTRFVKPLIAEDRGPTRSELEDTFQRLIDTYDLPRAILNTAIGGYEVDAYFPDERLIVELDGYEVHKTRHTFESDRARDAELLASHGIPTIRLTYRRMTQRPDHEAANLKRILEARGEAGRRSHGAAPPR
ncbi:MAG: type IV toxin-antitoxin system AbiEi family antitoxin domain-containing protein [Solirubrobacteraceae bacterium]